MVVQLHLSLNIRMLLSGVVCATFLLCVISASNLPNGHKDSLNVCLDGKHHKTSPGPENNLHGCSAWNNNSCCHNVTAFHSTTEDAPLYGFNLSHCGSMSEECKNWFYDNNCFYECSPNVGPWTRPVKSRYRNEKIENVPLCASQCNSWWSACRNESTCVEHWNINFKWTNNPRGNICPPDKPCKSFVEIFHNATYFCENVYGPYDYKVVEDTMCIHIRFTKQSMNVKVAEYYARKAAETTTTKIQNSNGSTDFVPLPPYIPPSETPPLQVHGTVASLIIAILIIIAACVGIACCAYRKWRPNAFRHQGIPVQFPSSIIRSKPVVTPHGEDRMAEMSFMQYDDDDEAEDDDTPKLNGSLQMKL